jgi:hypothetical protein
MNENESDDRLARGLARLTEIEPPAAAWSGLEARLDGNTRRRHGGAGLAVAAVGVAVALGVMRLGSAPGPASGAAPAALATAPQPGADAALDRSSEQLEVLLAALPPTRVGRASTGLTTTMLEDRIAAVDERLSLPDGVSLPDATKEALKRQRVVLLASLVRVRYASSVAGSL